MSTTLRADIEATVKEWRKHAESAENRKIFKSEGTTAANALRYCADTLERLISQHTGEGQVTDEIGTLDCPVCGVGKPHSHSKKEIAVWVDAQAGRFGYSLLDVMGIVPTYEQADVAAKGYSKEIGAWSTGAHVVEQAFHRGVRFAAMNNAVLEHTGEGQGEKKLTERDVIDNPRKNTLTEDIWRWTFDVIPTPDDPIFNNTIDAYTQGAAAMGEHIRTIIKLDGRQ